MIQSYDALSEEDMEVFVKILGESETGDKVWDMLRASRAIPLLR